MPRLVQRKSLPRQPKQCLRHQRLADPGRTTSDGRRLGRIAQARFPRSPSKRCRGWQVAIGLHTRGAYETEGAPGELKRALRAWRMNASVSVVRAVRRGKTRNGRRITVQSFPGVPATHLSTTPRRRYCIDELFPRKQRFAKVRATWWILVALIGVLAECFHFVA